ncbi:FAD-dependent oxidoreductase [Paenibacillus daejeonensis]|uniref:FAD-dependent oxidoreductase n=1 Tax=Paenibacillus daejeonensis TaxID=135193 RepID=UPI0003769D1F|nr:FAD-dependent oxidoreductase [Paenibacillus daejeonensis]
MADIDIVVLGGGLAGCAMARQAAELGLRAAIVERRGTLGHEIVATDRTWLRNGSSDATIPVLGGGLRKQLLQEQLDAGQVPLFFSAAAALAVGEEGTAGVLIGNKYGLQLLKARAVVDTTGHGVAARLLGFAQPVAGPALVRYVMEMDNIDYFFESRQRVPGELELLGDEVLCRESVKSRTLQVEFAFVSALGEGRRNARAILESEAKRRAYRLACWLREHVEAFASSRLSYLPWEAWIGGVDEEGAELLGQQAGAEQPEERKETEGPETPNGLYRLWAPTHPALSTSDLAALEKQAKVLAQQILSELPTGARPVAGFAAGHTYLPVSDCQFSAYDDSRLDVDLIAVAFDDAQVRQRIAAPAIVAGTGTAGTMAAAALREMEVSPVVLEANSELGGTSVVGLVSGYWNGYQGGMNRRRDRAIADIAAEVTGKRMTTDVASSIILQHLALEPEMPCIHTGTLVCGTLTEGKRVRGVLAVDDYGLFAIDAPVTIDATGDADVAYLAGCAYEYGDPRDGTTQTASLWGEDHWKTRNVMDYRYFTDLDMIYNDKYSELLRGLYLGHRHNSDYRFSPMLTVRESRRIVGEARLTMRDIVQETVPEDCVGVTQTPVDFHGRGSAYFVHLGLYESHYKLKARIPYRCYIPRGYDGVLVTGKSFSSTRDAACIGRMNADLRHAGYAVGLAASMALRSGTDVRSIDVTALQQQLIEREILPDWALAAPEEPVVGAGAEEVKTMRLLMAPGLEEATRATLDEEGGLNAPSDERLRLVRAWFGDETALGELAELLERFVRGGELDRVSAVSADEDKMRNRQINQCIALLGKSGNTRYVPTLALVLDAAGPGGPVAYHKQNAYGKGRRDAHRVPHYARLLTLCHAAERLADERLSPGIAKLLADGTLSGYLAPEKHGDVPPFFCSYLELCIARAAARCGVRAGAARLADYAGDARYVLSRLAQRELTLLAGTDQGKTPDDWHAWLAAQPSFASTPYTGPIVGYDDEP